MVKKDAVMFGYNEEQMNKIDAVIKTRKKVFARLLEIPLIKLTTKELQVVKDSSENVYIAIEHTLMKDHQICRMSGIDQRKLDWLRNNKEKFQTELNTYFELNKEVSQEHSLLFTPDVVRTEMEDMEEIMYALYKNEMPPEDICEYCRMFIIDDEWKIFMRTFQKRFRDECTKEYRNRMNEKLRYEREQKKLADKSNLKKEIRSATKQERLKNFLAEEIKEPEEKKLNPSDNVIEENNISKKTITATNGETYTIWR